MLPYAPYRSLSISKLFCKDGGEENKRGKRVGSWRGRIRGVEVGGWGGGELHYES